MSSQAVPLRTTKPADHPVCANHLTQPTFEHATTAPHLSAASDVEARRALGPLEYRVRAAGFAEVATTVRALLPPSLARVRVTRDVVLPVAASATKECRRERYPTTPHLPIHGVRTRSID